MCISQNVRLLKHHFFKLVFLNVNPNFLKVPAATSIDHFLTLLPTMKGTISVLYSLIHLQYGRMIYISKQQRRNGSSDCVRFTPSISAGHELIQCKIPLRYHLTKVRRGPGYMRTFILSETDVVNLPLPIFICFGFTQFMFRSILYNFIHYLIPCQTICNFLFTWGHPRTCKINSHDETLKSFLSLLARRLLSVRWKLLPPPTHHSWRHFLLC